LLALYIAGGVIVVLVCMLLVPLRVTFRLNTTGAPPASGRAEWLFGLVKRDIMGRPAARPATGKTKPATARRRRLPGFGSMNALAALSARLLRALRFERLDGFLRFGLDDPASTGIAFGWLQAALAVACLPPGSNLQIQPDFTEPVLEADIEGKMSVVPLRVAGIMGRFAMTRDGRRALGQLRAMR
jgi:hypothetical protein